METTLYLIGLSVATALWGYIFYKKDYHPQPVRLIAQAFVLGLLSVLPIFGYQYLYQNYLPFLSSYTLLQPLLKSGLVIGLAYLLFNLSFLALMLFVLSFVLSEAFTIFSGETLKNSFRALKDEPLNFVAVGVLMGLALLGERLAEQWIRMPILTATIGSLVFLVIIEEYVKHLLVRLVDDKKLKEVDDAITLSIMVGLAFAFAETIIYGFLKDDLGLMGYRIFLSIPVHIVASGIFGYYYGLAHFAEPITACLKKNTCAALIHKAFTLKKSTAYREEKMLEGLLYATVFHLVANILFELNLAFIVVPVVVLGLWIIFYLYDQKISRKRWTGAPGGMELLPKNY